MKRLQSTFLFTIFSIFICSCSTDEDDIVSSVVGEWELTEWNANISLDLNNDTIFNTNLLEEIDCINNEILTFEDNGVVASSNTFNSKIEFYLIESMQEYNVNIDCAMEGSIGFASTYIETANTIEFNGSVSELRGNQIIRTFEDEIEVYNETHTEIIATRDLILVYTKR